MPRRSYRILNRSYSWLIDTFKMATAYRISTFVCLCLNFVIVVLQFLPASYSKTVLTVPSSAELGYAVSQIACSRKGVLIRTLGDNTEEFYNKFVITSSGILVVRSAVRTSIDTKFYFTARETNSCFDNKPSHQNYIVHIKDFKNVVHFSKRQYTGTVSHPSVKGAVIQGLHNISFTCGDSIKVQDLKFKLKGPLSENFEVLTTSLTSVQVTPRNTVQVKKQFLHFTLGAELDGLSVGVTDVNIIVVHPQDNSGYGVRAIYRPEPVLLKDTVSNGQLVAHFDQKDSKGCGYECSLAHHRVRRQTPQTVTQSVSIPESRTGKLFTVDPGLPSGVAYTFTITDVTPENIFTVDNGGNVSLKANSKLDYDFGHPQSYTINIDVLDGGQGKVASLTF